MATISTAIRVQDGFSGALRSMSNALQLTLNSFEQVQQASGNAVNTTAIQAARAELARTASAFNQIENEISQANVQQHNFNGSINAGYGSANRLLGIFGSIVATYASIAGLGQLLDLSDEFVSTRARLDLINDGLQTTQQLQDIIRESAERSFAPYLQTADLVAKLANNAGDAFANTKEIVGFSELLSKSFANAGTNAEGISSATVQLTQALGSGVLRGEELNAVLEAAPSIVQNIEKYLGITRSELRKLASDGQITADVVKNALFAAAQDINGEFAALPVTFSQLFIRFKDQALFAFEAILTKLNEIANNQKFQAFLNGLIGGLSSLASAAIFTLDIMASIGGFLYDAWAFIGPVIGIATGAVVAYYVALGVAKVASLAYVGLQALQVFWYGLMTAGTYTAAGAVAALNAAFLANPIVWVIGIIAALIALLYVGVAAFNHFAGTSVSATGIIAGAFMFLVTYIGNLLTLLANNFISFAEFLYNVFKNPLYSIQKLFVNLANTGIDLAISLIGSFDSAATNLANMFVGAANTAITAINGIIGALNVIPGINLGDGFSKIEARTSVKGDLSGLKNKLTSSLGKQPDNYKSFDKYKFDFKSATDAAAKGYQQGANLAKGTPKSAGTGIDLNSLIGGGLGNAVGDALKKDDKGKKKAAKDTAKNTKKLADSATIITDDLKYLRDLSEREAINRYTTGEIKIDARSENTISSDMDLDGFINGVATQLEEAVDAVAEGRAFNV